MGLAVLEVPTGLREMGGGGHVSGSGHVSLKHHGPEVRYPHPPQGRGNGAGKTRCLVVLSTSLTHESYLGSASPHSLLSALFNFFPSFFRGHISDSALRNNF